MIHFYFYPAMIRTNQMQAVENVGFYSSLRGFCLIIKIFMPLLLGGVAVMRDGIKSSMKALQRATFLITTLVQNFNGTG